MILKKIMNRNELFTTIANQCNSKFKMNFITPAMVSEILCTTGNVIIEALRENQKVSIRGFGTIQLVDYDGRRKAWNPFRQIPMEYTPIPRIRIIYSQKIKNLLRGKSNG